MKKSKLIKPSPRDTVLDVLKELENAVNKYPTWPTDPLHALGVVSEEFGELSKEVLQGVYEPHKTNRENLKKEALQLAAMSLRFIASLDSYKFKKGRQHKQQKFLLPDYE